ncbi:MAG: Eco57I restriction-modification methylase domain-containing protein [Candidatus Thorarchaeota archaeon]|jgi:hypothetical protein
MVSRKNVQRHIRKIVKVRDSLSDELGGGSRANAQSNLVLQQQVFLSILREITDSTPDFHEFRNLGLFAKSRRVPEDEFTSIPTDYLELLPQFDRNKEAILDQRILFLGEVFEGLKSQVRRKRRGIYYTPYGLASIISNLALDAIESNNDNAEVSQLLALKVWDNACGSGTFLFTTLDAMLTRISEKATTVVLDGSRVKASKYDVIASYLISHSLYGQDLDEAAINIAEAQLWLALYGLAGSNPSTNIRGNFTLSDTLISEVSSRKYDVIIGNPPYMRLTSKDDEYKQSIKKRYALSREYNTHALFVQASLEHLKPRGILCYLIHKNLLTLDTFRRLRRSLIDSQQLIHLSDCGPGIFRGVTAETAILALQKGLSKAPESIALSTYNSQADKCTVSAVIGYEEYRRLISPWNDRFLLHVSPLEMPFLHHMANLPKLSEKVTIKRGIETGCNRRYVSDAPNPPGNWKPLLRGRDIARYAATSHVYLNHKIDALAKPGRVDLLEIPKVLLQQNAQHPIAFFDAGQFLVLNSLTYLSDASEGLLKGICVILNSNLISWFFRSVMTNNAGLTVNLLPNNLGMIPLPQNLDESLFSLICDMLTKLRLAFATSHYESNDFSIMHEIVAESLVIEAYFPHIFKEQEATHRLRPILNSFDLEIPSSFLVDDKSLLIAKDVLRNLSLSFS